MYNQLMYDQNNFVLLLKFYSLLHINELENKTHKSVVDYINYFTHVSFLMHRHFFVTLKCTEYKEKQKF
jgi:hypothetical protein